MVFPEEIKTSPPTPLLQGEGRNAPPTLAGKGAGGLGFTHNFSLDTLVGRYQITKHF